MSPEFHLIHTSWQENEAALNAVRRAVFIDEQRVPEALEWDGLDASCHHVLVTAAGNRPVGTGRMKPDGHIGRMAVLRDCRGQGIGSAILTALLDFARQQHCIRVYLHAQVAAIPFYEKHGFTVDGERFMDAGIPHRSMVRRLVSQD
ncbi:MAG TPA: GNAT family N-acetyltransferase [Gammaproteobacteria bacterium]|nr:GNAT family N-acetyltransferase [Gammaproteobacteria bacterium]